MSEEPQSSLWQAIPGATGWQVCFKSRGQQRGVDRVLQAPDGATFRTVHQARLAFPDVLFNTVALNTMQDLVAKKLVAQEARFMSTDHEYEKDLLKRRTAARLRGAAPNTHSAPTFAIRARLKDDAKGPLSYHDPSSTLKHRPRMIVAPKWYTQIIEYTHTIEKLFDKHSQYHNPYHLNDSVDEGSLIHFGLDPKLASERSLYLTSSKYLDFGSLLLLATENIRTLTDGWKTAFTHMDKKTWLAFTNALKESEIRCSPSLYVDGMCLFLQCLKPHNLLPTIGSKASLDSLISSIKTQTINQIPPTLNNSEAFCCCCCHSLMKPSEVKRLIPKDEWEENEAAKNRRSSRRSGRRGQGGGGGKKKKKKTKVSSDLESESSESSSSSESDSDDDENQNDMMIIRSVLKRTIRRVERDEGLTEYERHRRAKIEKNNAYLQSLGIVPISGLAEGGDGKKMKKAKKKAKESPLIDISGTIPSNALPLPAPAPTPSLDNPSATDSTLPDAQPPKKPPTAFSLFLSENRVDVVAKHPSATFGEIGKHLGAMWRALSRKEKKSYSKRAAATKKQYESDVKAYKKAHPAPPPANVTTLPPSELVTTKAPNDKDPEELELPSFTPHPVFKTYMCLPCAHNYAHKMKTFTFAAVDKPSSRPMVQTQQLISLRDFHIEEEEAKNPNDFMCELCARHSAPKKTPIFKLPVDAAVNVVCTRKGCDSSFCERCILFLMGGSELSLAKHVPGWICFICRDAPFVRKEHAIKLYKFLQPGNPQLISPKDLENGTNTMDMGGGYEEKEFTLETFQQQQYLIDNANKMNRSAQLTKRDLSFFGQEGIRVLSLFGGIEASLVAIKQLSLKVDLYVSCELDEDARKVTAANHVDLLAKAKLVFVNDVLDIDASLLAGLQKTGSIEGGFHLVIGGSPCQDFSFQGNLNGGPRAGLEGDRGKLVYEFFRVLSLVERMNARIKGFPKPIFVYENVSGMEDRIKKEITNWLGVVPTRLNADLFSPASRPRDFYTNLPVELLPADTETNDMKIPTLQQILTPPAQALIPKAKCIITSNGAEVYATGRTNLFYQHDKKWIDHFNRVYRNRYDRSLGFRNLSIEEVEKLSGLPPGYTSVIKTARSKDFNTCWGLLGNMFSVPVIVYLLSPFLQNFPTTNYHSPQRYPFTVALTPRIPLPDDALKTPDGDGIATAPTTPNDDIVIVRKLAENNSDYNNDEIDSDEEDYVLPGPEKWTPGLDSLAERFQFVCCDQCNSWRRIPHDIVFEDGENFTCQDNVWTESTFEKACKVRGATTSTTNFATSGNSTVIADTIASRNKRAVARREEGLADEDDRDDMESKAEVVDEAIIPEFTEASQAVVDELQAQLKKSRQEVRNLKENEVKRLLHQQELIQQLATTASVPSTITIALKRSNQLTLLQEEGEEEEEEQSPNVEQSPSVISPPLQKKRRVTTTHAQN